MVIERDLECIAEQERVLRFPSFNPETAWQLGALLRDFALQQQLPVAIDVSLHSMPLFYAAMNGSSPDNAQWIRRKRNTVLRLFRSSYAVGLRLAKQQTTLEEKLGLSVADFAAHGGGFPIFIEDTGCIGAVTVSGLPQRDDHNLVVKALAKLLGKTVPQLVEP
ncbi:MAG: heme-degrading domain-containing protein [Phyllobacterium sp.]